MKAKPLKGITVLDLTNVLAGPFCCHQLVHLGATVIKVEQPKRGDLARQLGADADLNATYMGISFLAQNAGKKSITLNLKTKQGVEILKKLVEKADVLVENFRPKVMERLALSYEILKKSNPRLIYCAISGFGQQGVLSHRPAYDQIIQGLSGVMSITGEREIETDGKNGKDASQQESQPLRVGYPIADTVGGLTASMAICAALNANPRGGFIDISMLEATMATMGWVVSNYLIGGVEPRRNGNENLTSAPSGSFATKSGMLNIAANKDLQWEMLADCLDLSSLKNDKSFSTRENRKKNRYQLKRLIEEKLKTKEAAEWEKILNKIGIPCAVVLTVPQALHHVRDRDQISRFENVDGVDKVVEVLKTGMRFDGEPLSVQDAPATLGRDTQKILDEIGIDETEFKSLKSKGVV